MVVCGNGQLNILKCLYKISGSSIKIMKCWSSLILLRILTHISVYIYWGRGLNKIHVQSISQWSLEQRLEIVLVCSPQNENMCLKPKIYRQKSIFLACSFYQTWSIVKYENSSLIDYTHSTFCSHKKLYCGKPTHNQKLWQTPRNCNLNACGTKIDTGSDPRSRTRLKGTFTWWRSFLFLQFKIKFNTNTLQADFT